MSTSLAVMRTSLKENEKQIIAKLGGDDRLGIFLLRVPDNV